MNRFSSVTPAAQPSSQRKSRPDGKMSFIPKPKLSRQGSMDRLSEVGWRGGMRPRSNSFERPRATIAASRPSHEPSATKLPPSQKSRSQQSEGMHQMTPLNKPKSYARSTTTPMRTPSTDRSGRSWLNSFERALAFVTAKDKRPISNVNWQKAAAKRINEELERRGAAGAGSVVLMRPLTITRFVEVVAALLVRLSDKQRVDAANYVTKLPHIAKRLLYPAVVSKSWLKTVNTLHTYPSALALVAYLLDLVLRLESPVDKDTLYAEKDEVSCLRREFLLDAWCWFNQELQDDSKLVEEYLQNLRRLLGNDDEVIAQLKETMEGYHLELNDPSEQAARADEQQRLEALNQTCESLREQRARRIQDRGRMDAACSQQTTLLDTLRQIQAEKERAGSELQQLQQEVAAQELSTAERAELLDQVDYANRVIDSKNELVQQVSRMLKQKETELAASQKMCLAACVEYNQGIISVSSAHADCAGLAVEESDLMKSCFEEKAERALQALKEKHHQLTDALKEAEKNRLATMRRLSQQNYQLEHIGSKFEESREKLERERLVLRGEREAAAAERERAARDVRELAERADRSDKMAAELPETEVELAHWERQDTEWRQLLQEMSEYIAEQREAAPRRLAAAKQQRAELWFARAAAITDEIRQIHCQYNA